MKVFQFKVFEGITPMANIRVAVTDKYMAEKELGKFDPQKFIDGVIETIEKNYGDTLTDKDVNVLGKELPY